MSSSSSDVCVIGGGVIGLATAVGLRDRGLEVTCLERGQPGHGQSAGRTRQFRHLHATAELIELAVRSRQGWREWEQRFERTLLGDEGALRAGSAPGELDALKAAGVAAVELDADDARARFPIAALPKARLLWDPLAGAIRAADTIAALTEALGSAVQQTEVSSIAVAADHDSVEVHTR